MPYSIEQIVGELDKNNFNPMVHIASMMPDSYEPKSFSHPDLEEYFQAKSDSSNGESALFVAKQKSLADHVVGLAGVEIEERLGVRTAVVTELAVAPRARGHDLGRTMLADVIDWSQGNGAEVVQIDTVPEPRSHEEMLLKELDFEPSSDGKPELVISNY